MIRLVKGNNEKLLYIDYKLKTIIPFIKDNEEKLKVIMYVNEEAKKISDNIYIIKNNFKKVGMVVVDNGSLDLLYIIDKYRNKTFGSKVLAKLKNEIKTIKVRKNNKRAINFYLKNGFKESKRQKDIIYLERI